MACRLFGAKPLPELALTKCHDAIFDKWIHLHCRCLNEIAVKGTIGLMNAIIDIFELHTQILYQTTPITLGTPPGQNSHYFRHFQTHFLRWKYQNFDSNSLKFVPKGPIDNNSALVQVMAWRSTDDKPLPEPMLTQFTDIYAARAVRWFNVLSRLNTGPLKFGLTGPIEDESTLVQVMALCRTGDKSLPEPIETVSPEGTFCDTVQVPSLGGAWN